jgi:hypothetical protein
VVLDNLPCHKAAAARAAVEAAGCRLLYPRSPARTTGPHTGTPPTPGSGREAGTRPSPPRWESRGPARRTGNRTRAAGAARRTARGEPTPTARRP